MQAAYGCVQADYACAQYFPQQAEEEPLIVELVVPDDAPPGTKLEYIAPDGQELRLTVPDGVPPGSIMTLTQDPATGAWRCMAEPGDRQEMPYGSPPATAPVPEAPRVVTEQPAAYVSATAPSAAAVAGWARLFHELGRAPCSRTPRCHDGDLRGAPGHQALLHTTTSRGDRGSLVHAAGRGAGVLSDEVAVLRAATSGPARRHSALVHSAARNGAAAVLRPAGGRLCA